MKILTNKTWEKFNNEYIDFQLEIADLKDDNNNYKDQVDTIVKINRELSETIVGLEEKLKDTKKEIVRLKTLCTKNKIDYKVKKESKNGKK